MQTLNQYLKHRRKSDFAKKIGIRADVLSQYLSGYRRPGFDLMVRIEAETGGEVPVGSWAVATSHGDTLADRQDQTPLAQGAAE
ncbi:MAG: helix-turn-helix domain-containing protein [bacterium]|jgi:transcriptional regulator with XRE-family HTH domain